MWTSRDWVRVGVSGSGAFALTLALLWSSPTHAVDGAEANKTITTPVYRDGSCEITGKISGAEGILGTRTGITFIKPGKVPVMQLTVHNTAHEAATAHFNVA